MSREHSTYEDLRFEMIELAEQVAIGGLYAHYKDADSRYRVKGLIVLETDDVISVKYISETAPDVEWARPVSEWVETVIEPDGREVPRYTRVA